MPRLVVLSAVACLSLVAACVNTDLPSNVAECAKTHCSDSAGASGGGGEAGGATASTASLGGQGGSAGAGGASAGASGGTTSAGGASAGADGGTAGADGGTAGAGGASADAGGSAGASGEIDGGAAGTGGGGSSGSSDAGQDAPYLSPEAELPSDTKPSEPDAPVAVDTPIPGPEAGGPEAAPDATPDIARDLAVDLTPDTSPPRPEVGLDAGNCIQRFKANGYSLGTDASTGACSGCMENLISKNQQCRDMIDCLALSWPSCARGSACWTKCQNDTGSDSVVEVYVANITSAACGSH